MSSFVISKSEYVKAAGLVSGLAKELEVWLYDYETQRNSTPEDYKRRFIECFTMNSLSVQKQYDDGDAWTDSNEYNKEFNDYMKLGKQLVYNDGPALINAIHELSQFFGSCLYQTEYDPYMYKMQLFFDSIIVELFKKAHRYEADSWGELKIEAPKHQYQAIF